MILEVLHLQGSLRFLSTDVTLDNKVGWFHYPILFQGISAKMCV